jgi:hypothetical protein
VKYTNANAAATTASMINGFHAKSAIRDFGVWGWSVVIQLDCQQKNLFASMISKGMILSNHFSYFLLNKI